MENENVFSYRYSGEESNEIERIRKKYLPREENGLEKLRRLDRDVENAGRISSLSVGIIGTLVFGLGMCFGLDALAGADYLTLVFCLIGAIIMLCAYPVYRFRVQKVKAENIPEILRIADEIGR